MKCYYEELGIARDASDSDIKTAYRKLALRWHPDKNLDCADEAKEQFQLIQQAYDVLSDSHERAWYDNHREQILRGKNSEYEENCLDLFQYFTVSCFKGYGDDAKGFYKVYAEVFEKIAAEDAEFMDDEEEVAQIPTFGDSNSSYEDVVGPFYAYWQSYCTKKTYTWLSRYDIQEIKDRRILREIEKELKKVTQKAKKERNEEVRNLVSFVRKRDKRAQAYKKMLEERAVANRQKQEQNRIEQIRKRNKEVEEMRKSHKQNSALNEGYEEQLKQLEQQYAVGTTDEETADEDETAEEIDSKEINGLNALHIDEEIEYVDDLYCIACNKSFKNERAFANHESSKKHRENVERLKQEMQDDEEMYGDTTDEEVNNGEDWEKEAEDDNILFDKNEDGPDSTANINETESSKFGNEKEEEEEVNSVPINSNKRSKKNKKSKKANNSQTIQHAEESDLEDVNNLSQPVEPNEDSDDDWQNLNKKSIKKSRSKQTKTKPTNTQPTSRETQPKAEPQPKSEPHMIYNTDAAPAKPTCVTCKATFESKNKLFAHLKITKHGVYIPKSTKPDSVDSAKSKSKGKRK